MYGIALVHALPQDNNDIGQGVDGAVRQCYWNKHLACQSADQFQRALEIFHKLIKLLVRHRERDNLIVPERS